MANEANADHFVSAFRTDRTTNTCCTQASSHLPTTLNRVRELEKHPSFSLANPNKARALVSAFSRNAALFHAADGSGYAYVGEKIRELDGFNPQVAARMTNVFGRWKKWVSSSSSSSSLLFLSFFLSFPMFVDRLGGCNCPIAGIIELVNGANPAGATPLGVQQRWSDIAHSAVAGSKTLTNVTICFGGFDEILSIEPGTTKAGRR